MAELTGELAELHAELGTCEGTLGAMRAEIAAQARMHESEVDALKCLADANAKIVSSPTTSKRTDSVAEHLQELVEMERSGRAVAETKLIDARREAREAMDTKQRAEAMISDAMQRAEMAEQRLADAVLPNGSSTSIDTGTEHVWDLLEVERDRRATAESKLAEARQDVLRAKDAKEHAEGLLSVMAEQRLVHAAPTKTSDSTPATPMTEPEFTPVALAGVVTMQRCIRGALARKRFLAILEAEFLEAELVHSAAAAAETAEAAAAAAMRLQELGLLLDADEAAAVAAAALTARSAELSATRTELVATVAALDAERQRGLEAVASAGVDKEIAVTEAKLEQDATLAAAVQARAALGAKVAELGNRLALATEAAEAGQQAETVLVDALSTARAELSAAAESSSSVELAEGAASGALRAERVLLMEEVGELHAELARQQAEHHAEAAEQKHEHAARLKLRHTDLETERASHTATRCSTDTIPTKLCSASCFGRLATCYCFGQCTGTLHKRVAFTVSAVPQGVVGGQAGGG